MDMYEHEYSTMVFRRFHVDIFDSVYKSFKTASRGLDFNDYYYFQQDHIKSIDDKASVRFRGLDDEENIKGMEDINVVYLNECIVTGKQSYLCKKGNLKSHHI